MAAFNHIRDLNDVALKPRLLRNLVNEHLPTETSPFRNPADIADVVSAIKTHQLLSEEVFTSDQKLVSSWKSAMDVWLHRILLLARTNSPDKSWAGVCLLGVTCTGCSPERFLSSFSDWFNVLVPHIQQSGVSETVRVASCAAASDLLTRLGGFSNIKKDGISCAGKLVQPILKMLNEDATQEISEVAAQLLYTVLIYFPSSFHRCYDNAEAAIVSKIMSGNCHSSLLKKLACCLASLPKSKGDEESWSLMMQKILLSLSALFDSVLEGLEEDSTRSKAVTLLVPPGKSPPPPLGGQIIGGQAIDSGDRSLPSVISVISCLVQCCCTMLTSSYQVQVVVPVRSLLAIVGRVLLVNGSLSEALQPFTTAMQQELVCLHLPALHQNVFGVLDALHKGLHSQVVPHAPEIVWLLIKYFERCQLPELRTKAYTIFKTLLISMGAGMALYISQVVIDNGMSDLKVTNFNCDKELSNEVSAEPSQWHHRKKRKQTSASGPLVEQQASFCSEMKVRQEHQASVSLKIAAVEALEALVIVGGALRSDSWRSDIDNLLMAVATNACKGFGNHVGKPSLLSGPGTASEEFQLVALRALLASLLSPASVRPPYLAQGLDLFLKGKQNGGTRVAEFCAQALLALEVLIHPRALPLVDVPSQIGNSFSSGGSKHRAIPWDSKVLGVYPDVYDVLDYVNMEDGFGSETLDISQPQEPNVSDDLSDKVAPSSIDDKIEGHKDLVMLDVPHSAEPNQTLSGDVPLSVDTPVLPAYPSSDLRAEVEKAVTCNTSEGSKNVS
ncbi:uncharacterized protein LOC141646758 [Silene latifolia]|uniref:uncharacterized protein LOC141646758 n=1 Tax=Silene latifolia TaxID=37657 RepID=UPI003D77281E